MTCTKCSEVEAVSGQRWCRGCFAAYKRTARVEEVNRKVKKARLSGCDDFKVLVISTFEMRGMVEFNGLAVAEIVRMLRVD